MVLQKNTAELSLRELAAVLLNNSEMLRNANGVALKLMGLGPASGVKFFPDQIKIIFKRAHPIALAQFPEIAKGAGLNSLSKNRVTARFDEWVVGGQGRIGNEFYLNVSEMQDILEKVKKAERYSGKF